MNLAYELLFDPRAFDTVQADERAVRQRALRIAYPHCSRFERQPHRRSRGVTVTDRAAAASSTCIAVTTPIRPSLAANGRRQPVGSIASARCSALLPMCSASAAARACRLHANSSRKDLASRASLVRLRCWRHPSHRVHHPVFAAPQHPTSHWCVRPDRLRLPPGAPPARVFGPAPQSRRSRSGASAFWAGRGRGGASSLARRPVSSASEACEKSRAYRMRVTALWKRKCSVGWPTMGCAVQRRRFLVGAKSTRRTAPAGSNRGRHGGDEVSEAPG
jgi:hypothetical protein